MLLLHRHGPKQCGTRLKVLDQNRSVATLSTKISFYFPSTNCSNSTDTHLLGVKVPSFSNLVGVST